MGDEPRRAPGAPLLHSCSIATLDARAGGGRIVVTSTGGTKMFFTETSLYLGTKGAVEQFVRVLSRELGERNVTVNAISPGFTDTDLLPDRDRAPAPRP